jgi:hypothetical protein
VKRGDFACSARRVELPGMDESNQRHGHLLTSFSAPRNLAGWGRTNERESTMKIFIAAAISGLLLAAAPATKDTDAKVTGTITFNGKPLSAAKVTFHFGDEFIGAKIKDDGRYTVSRIAPGTYRVTIEGKYVPLKFTFDDKTPLVAEIEEGKNEMNFALSE